MSLSQTPGKTELLNPSAASDEAALATPFLQALVRLVRAQDMFGAYASRPDAAMLERFIMTKEERKAAAGTCRADPDVLSRMDLFYGAIGLVVEEQTGIIASPMMKIHSEGFGRVVLTAGKLVVLSKHLRDAQRFGFETLADMANEGMKQIATAVTTIEAYPEVARA